MAEQEDTFKQELIAAIPHLRAFARSLCNDPTQADDLAQEALAKAWKARLLPATYVVGPDGRIRYSYIGELDWSREPVRKQIAELLPR